MQDPITSAQLASADIDMVIAPSGLREAPERYIHRLLETPRETFEHGAAYTGRPTTWLYQNAHHVIKIRSEYRLAARDARRWIERTAGIEHRLRVHHPDKGWFLIHCNTVSLIASLTLFMRPLHQEVKRITVEALCGYLERMLTLYLRTAADFHQRLDEGLSNFAIAPDGQLYYIDDDVYTWDAFTSFTQAIGFWFRALPQLTEEASVRLGATLQRLLAQCFHDRHTIRVVANLIRRVPLVNAAQKQCRDAFLSGLEPTASQAQGRRTSSREPIALLADIHANFPALQAVLDSLDQRGIGHALVLGDLVGYGPHPHEVIQTVRERGFAALKGNHDYAVAENQYKKGFSTYAKVVAEWTRARLDAEELAWLDGLPLYWSQDDWLAVHGAPQDPMYIFGYVYHMTYESNLAHLDALQIPICFHGHSHVTGVYYATRRGLKGNNLEAQQCLADYRQCLVCPGSVGQPRDNDGAEARFAVFQPRTKQVTFYRVEYDVEATIHDMLAHGLPAVLAQRLREGV